MKNEAGTNQAAGWGCGCLMLGMASFWGIFYSVFGLSWPIGCILDLGEWEYRPSSGDEDSWSFIFEPAYAWVPWLCALVVLLWMLTSRHLLRKVTTWSKSAHPTFGKLPRVGDNVSDALKVLRTEHERILWEFDSSRELYQKKMAIGYGLTSFVLPAGLWVGAFLAPRLGSGMLGQPFSGSRVVLLIICAVPGIWTGLRGLYGAYQRSRLDDQMLIDFRLEQIFRVDLAASESDFARPLLDFGAIEAIELERTDSSRGFDHYRILLSGIGDEPILLMKSNDEKRGRALAELLVERFKTQLTESQKVKFESSN